MKSLLFFSIMLFSFSANLFADTTSNEINCQVKLTLRENNQNKEFVLKSFVLKDNEEIIDEGLLIKFFKGEDNNISIFYYTLPNLFIAGGGGNVTSEHPVVLMASGTPANLIYKGKKLIKLFSTCQFSK